MSKQRDRHLEAPGEANRDKHINFLAEEEGNLDPASEDFGENENEVDTAHTAARNSMAGVEAGLFPGDDNRFKTPSDDKNDRSGSAAPGLETAIPLDADEKETLADKISINKSNDDIVTPVTDEQNTSDRNEDDQAH